MRKLLAVALLVLGVSALADNGRIAVATSSTRVHKASGRTKCVQNLATVAIYCKEGETAVTVDNFDIVLKGGDAASDGLGALYCWEGSPSAIRCMSSSGAQYVSGTSH